MTPCKTCNTPLQGRQTHFCSAECRFKAQPNGKHFPCLNCGEAVYRRPSVIKRNKSGEWFCSGDCKNTYKRKQSTVTCPICDKRFYIHAHRIARNKHPVTCSMECKLALLQWETLLVYCDCCGDEIYRKQSEVNKREHHFCNRTCMGEWQAQNKTGENSNSWLGGYPQYHGKDWIGNRRKAKRRDKNTCQSCDTKHTEANHTLEVHHIKPIRLFDNRNDANHLDNLITLCRSCHIKFDVFARWFFDQARRQSQPHHPLQNHGAIARVYLDSKTDTL